MGQDAHSINTDPAFASAGGTLATNYQVPLASVLPGITIAGQTVDYAGITRAATPTIGAYEKSIFSQVVTFTAITAKTYGDADFTPTVTASSGLTAFTYSSSNTAVATVNSSTGLVHIVGAGMANITATQAGNATWAAASASSSLTVNAKVLTLASAVAQNKSYDGTNAAVLTGTLTGVINSDDVTVAKTGTFATIAMGTGIAVTSTSTLGGTKAGNYSLTQPTGLTANITGGVQAITFAALAAKTYGDAPFIVSATGGASGNPVTFSSSDPTVASCSGTNGTTVTMLKAGSCAIYADQAGDVNYAAAPQVPQTLTINKADQVITLSPLPVGSLLLNTFTTIQVTATSNSGLLVAISLGAGSAATLNVSNQLENIGVTGTVVINLSAEANDNYNASNSSYTFDVTKSNQSITFGALSGVAYTPGLTVPLSGAATASSALAVTYSVVSGPATITGTTLNISGAGEVVVAASQAGDATWNPAADVTQTLTVSQATQTITFAALAAKNYGDAAFTLSATGGGSGNPVTFSSSDPSIASCDGTNGATVTILKAGICVIYANQAGNSSYTAAAQVTQTLTINKGDQLLTIGSLPVGSLPLNQFTDPVQVTATSTSGLTVVITLGSGSVATLNGSNQLENIGQTGTVMINLSQDGNDNYNAATGSYTFDVVKSNQSITFDALTNKAMGDPDYSPGATASSALTVSYTSSNTAVATIVSGQIHIVGAGSTTITASQDGDATWNPALDVAQSLTVTESPSWTGAISTNWNDPGNWNPAIVPTASDNVLIPNLTNDPIVNEDAATPAICNNLEIETGAVLTIAAGKALTVNGTLTNNAGNTGLVIQSTTAGTGSLLNNTANVAATAQRYIAGWSDANHGWHFLSSPVASQAISGFHTAGSGNDFYKWDEPTNEWINRTATGGGLNGSFETDFFVGRGYMIANSTNSTKTFSGILNVSDVPLTGLTNTTGKTYRGWHLVGNPFSSAIKWTQGSWVKTNIATYSQIWNETTASYKVLAGGGIIPAHNGFQVYVAEGGGSLTIPADARLHSDSLWYKNLASANEIVLLARDLKGKTAQESIISFNPEATEDFDMAHDSYFMAGFAPMFYSISQNGLYALNTLPELKSEMVIPMGFVKNQSTDFSIELTQNIPGQTLYLIDLKTNNEHKISESPYSFTSVNGDNPNRFLLKFGTTGIGDTPTTPQINAWVYNNMLYVNNPEGNTKIEVFNLNGQCLLNRELFGLGVQSMPLHQPTGLYLIRLTGKGKTITIKANILMN
jgi:hypothetical protein